MKPIRPPSTKHESSGKLVDNCYCVVFDYILAYEALASEIADKYKKGQPVLVGTTSIEKNEIVDQLLKRKKIPHNVLIRSSSSER